MPNILGIEGEIKNAAPKRAALRFNLSEVASERSIGASAATCVFVLNGLVSRLKLRPTLQIEPCDLKIVAESRKVGHDCGGLHHGKSYLT